MAWKQLVITNINKNLADNIEEFLEFEALSVTYQDAYDIPIFEPLPGEVRLWDDLVLTALFNMDYDLENLKIQILDNFDIDDSKLEVSILEDKVWEKEYLKDFHPMQFGNNLWIFPVDTELTKDDLDKKIVFLDPGIAFGTGSHNTTSLCLTYLDSLDLKGKLVLDFGCGSGILGLAAAKLGASKVVGIDIEPQAIDATLRNAKTNSVDNKFETYLSPGEKEIKLLKSSADCVVANILAKPLIELSDSIISLVKEDGILALSGILKEQLDEVQKVYEKKISFIERRIDEDWGLLVFKK
ncbi:MAG: 50S ribosomal protein L11 methyltransferase [Psittacicella sp.]